FTMEQEFYKNRLIERYELDVLVPNKYDRQVIHKIIYEELCLGEVKDGSKSEYLRIIDLLSSQGAEAVILGCTEIGMLVNQGDTNVKLIDTTEIHAKKAVEYAI
ncbi:MAG TPA: aspartate racemase, partial [Ignavibacteria bacterium]|nr:aspartate racemase [Ignavibacteria bacterium]